MFFRLLLESFRRQKRRKALAGVAILLGTTAVTAMLALATTIGDRIHQELAVYGANIVVVPRAAALPVTIGGVDVKAAVGEAYLRESDLDKLQTIFWHNNLTAVSPEFRTSGRMHSVPAEQGSQATWLSDDFAPGVTAANLTDRPVDLVGYWFDHPFGNGRTGAPQLHPWWKLQGRWPSEQGGKLDGYVVTEELAVGAHLAQQFHLRVGDTVVLRTEHIGRIVGIVSSGDQTDEQLLYSLDATSSLMRPIVKDESTDLSAEITRVEIAARTRPEDAFARRDPDSLSPHDRDLWYCRPYANSIAYQIQEAIPGSTAQQVRKVEQSEGNVLARISGLMWLISGAALVAAGFAVSAAMATAVLERRAEIGLMRSLGAGRAAIAALFLSESALLALAGGALGFVLGSLLASLLGARIFPADAHPPMLNPVLLPAILLLAVAVALAGSAPSIRAALNADPANTLRGTA